MSQVKYQLALVTGASSGIGEAVCRLLATKGINLIITARHEGRLEALRKDLEKQVSVDVVQAELLDPEGLKKVLAAIRERAPDLIINNAGCSIYGPTLQKTADEQCQVIDLNCRVMTQVAMESARSLISHGKTGCVMNVSSASAFQPFPFYNVYAASKAYVNAFTEAFNDELKPYGVAVLAACPGQVDTRFRKRAGSEVPAEQGAMVMSPEFAASEIWKQIQKGQCIRIFSGIYRLLIGIGRLLPRFFQFRAQKRQILARYPDTRILNSEGTLILGSCKESHD